MPNNELLEETMTWIEEHPELHDQDVWLQDDRLDYWNHDIVLVPAREDLATCGTSACFAGWAVLLSGRVKAIVDETHVIAVNGKEEQRNIRYLAEEVLGLDRHSGTTLFIAAESRRDLRRAVDHLKEHGNVDGFYFLDDEYEEINA